MRPSVLLPALLVILQAGLPAAGAAIPRDEGPPPEEAIAVAGAGAELYGYLTPVVVVADKGQIIFTNLDLARHDFVHDVETDGFGGPKTSPWCGKQMKKKKKGGHHHDHHGADCPLFWSEVIGTGESTPVLGVRNLESGKSYSFFCTLHHSMKGKLFVTS